MRDFSIKVFVRKFPSTCPPLTRVHENSSRADLAPEISAMSQGTTPMGAGLVSLVLWQGLATSRARPWGCRVERLGPSVLDTADPSWLQWPHHRTHLSPSAKQSCPEDALTHKVLCKEQGVELPRSLCFPLNLRYSMIL